mmetsp:Transcript_30378/g.37255  ORF Transcript_30378/g.37255 Transcript_30378/m.37255 type:complete len:198 (+) Transcript_30378:45-638(+)
MRGELEEQSPKEAPPSEHRSLVASLKEKQLEELRAQVARCGTKCGKLRHDRHEASSRNFEDELTWTVQQMEMHRRQIEAHQRQLSILERRHAEIVTALANGGSNGGSVGKLFCMEDVLGSEVASTSSSKSRSTLLGFTNAMAAAEARLGHKDRHPHRDREPVSVGAVNAVNSVVPQQDAHQGWKTVFKAHWPPKAPP